MKEAINKAIESLTNKSKSATDAGDALKLSQAALNLSHVRLHSSQIEQAKQGVKNG